MVNGPEDLIDWDAIDWLAQEGQVRRLRQRIFKGGAAGDWKQARNLEKPMLRSRANTLVVLTLLASRPHRRQFEH